MKLCKDCKHGVILMLSKSLCERKAHKVISPVTGTTLIEGTRICSTERETLGSANHCGPSAQFFEPIPPNVLQRLFARFKQ